MQNDAYKQMLSMAFARNKWEKDNQREYESRQNKVDKLSREARIWGMIPGLMGTLGQIGGMAGLGAGPEPDTTGLPDLEMPAKEIDSPYNLSGQENPSPFSVGGAAEKPSPYSLMKRRRLTPPGGY